MEVPGKLDEEALSADNSTLVCLPCDCDGLKEPAYGFCQDCQEHLCETCFKHHRRARPFKKHVLIDKESMPSTRVSVPKTTDDTPDLCENHQDKALEFYCRDHRLVACYVCVTLKHKQCKVDYIPEVSGHVFDEMTEILKQMESLMTKCKSNIENVGKAANNLDQSHTKVVEDIKVFRKEINDCLDKMETRIMKEVNTFLKNAKCKQENIKAACLKINKELESLHSLLSTLKEENKQNKLFIEMKNAGKRLPKLTNNEKQVLDENRTEDCIQFTKNTSIIGCLKTVNEFGTFSARVQPSPDRAIDLHYTDTINVKSESDEKDCNITGMVMIAPTKMIVADNYNNSIKLIDVDKNAVVTETKMSSQPTDVVTFLENRYAVTLGVEKCIQIFSYKDVELSLDQRIDVKEQCNGLAYCQDRFVVSCQASRKIVIINLDGDILNVLGSPAIFYGPVSVMISKDERFLYVSDRPIDWYQHNKVLKLDWEGNVVNVFDESEYKVPHGLQQLEDETILVCYTDSDTIERLSSSIKRCVNLELDKENLYWPTVLTYCDRNHKLYVSCSLKKGKWQADCVKVFTVKWKY